MLIENVKLAFLALVANKLRTVLTMLGILIGIAAVITIMIVGDAMNNSVMGSMGEMGANNIEFYLEPKSSGDQEDNSANIREMKAGDYFSQEMLEKVLQKFGSSLQGISLKKGMGSLKYTSGKKYANISLTGENRTAVLQRKLTLLDGRSFNASDYAKGGRVAMVSDRFVENIYAGDNSKALGSTLEVSIGSRYYSYIIIGVYEYTESAGSFSSGTSQWIHSATVFDRGNRSLSVGRYDWHPFWSDLGKGDNEAVK